MHEHVKITSYVDVESVILDKSHSINVEIEALCHRRCRQCICRGWNIAGNHTVIFGVLVHS